MRDCTVVATTARSIPLLGRKPFISDCENAMTCPTVAAVAANARLHGCRYHRTFDSAAGEETLHLGLRKCNELRDCGRCRGECETARLSLPPHLRFRCWGGNPSSRTAKMQ